MNTGASWSVSVLMADYEESIREIDAATARVAELKLHCSGIVKQIVQVQGGTDALEYHGVRYSIVPRNDCMFLRPLAPRADNRRLDRSERIDPIDSAIEPRARRGRRRDGETKAMADSMAPIIADDDLELA